MDDKLYESIVKEALKLTHKEDFKKFTSAKFKKNMGIVHTKDYLRGIKIGYTLGISRAIANEKKFNELLSIVKKFLNNSEKIQNS